LLDANGNVKLIDFGFVNTFDGESLMDTFCGSVRIIFFINRAFRSILVCDFFFFKFVNGYFWWKKAKRLGSVLANFVHAVGYNFNSGPFGI
jgi:hypothetical protein